MLSMFLRVPLTLALSLVLGLTAVWPWSNNAAIYFDAGVHNGSPAYISSMYVSYEDGSNPFHSGYTSWTYNKLLVDGGRSSWELNRGVVLRFRLDGYGDRTCRIQTSKQFLVFSYATVKYLGNNQCSV